MFKTLLEIFLFSTTLVIATEDCHFLEGTTGLTITYAYRYEHPDSFCRSKGATLWDGRSPAIRKKIVDKVKRCYPDMRKILLGGIESNENGQLVWREDGQLYDPSVDRSHFASDPMPVKGSCIKNYLMPASDGEARLYITSCSDAFRPDAFICYKDNSLPVWVKILMVPYVGVVCCACLSMLFLLCDKIVRCIKPPSPSTASSTSSSFDMFLSPYEAQQAQNNKVDGILTSSLQTGAEEEARPMRDADTDVITPNPHQEPSSASICVVNVDDMEPKEEDDYDNNEEDNLTEGDVTPPVKSTTSICMCGVDEMSKRKTKKDEEDDDVIDQFHSY